MDWPGLREIRRKSVNIGLRRQICGEGIDPDLGFEVGEAVSPSGYSDDIPPRGAQRPRCCFANARACSCYDGTSGHVLNGSAGSRPFPPQLLRGVSAGLSWAQAVPTLVDVLTYESRHPAAPDP